MANVMTKHRWVKPTAEAIERVPVVTTVEQSKAEQLRQPISSNRTLIMLAQRTLQHSIRRRKLS